MKKFGSVTVLNGHIHQVIAEGRGKRNVSHCLLDSISATAAREGIRRGPMKVPAEQLKSVLGITDVNYVQRQHALAVVDSTLA